MPKSLDDRMPFFMHDVIVIGVGTMGSAACMELARRGVRVLGLEQFSIPHDRGSHHSRSRLFRMSYFEHADYVPLLKRAYQLWKHLDGESSAGPASGGRAFQGRQLFHETGAVYMGRPDGEVIAGSLGSARTHGLPHELLDHTMLERRFPQFRMPRAFTAMHEPQAGFVIPEAAVRAMAAEATRLGAEIRQNEAVLSWSADASGCRVTTGTGEHRAGRLIFCGGAWSAKLIADLGVPLEVTRQVLGWVQPRLPESFRLGRMPCWALESGPGALYYGFPMLPGETTLKLARHAKGDPADPDTVDRRPRPADKRDFVGAREFLSTDAAGPVASMSICLYTNSPDSHFIIDRHPRHDRVLLACGFSGHGFKFAPVIGEILADLATTGRSQLPVEFLGLRRFGS